MGAEAAEGDDEPLEDKMKRLTARLDEQFTERPRLESQIRKNLKGLNLAR